VKFLAIELLALNIKFSKSGLKIAIFKKGKVAVIRKLGLKPRALSIGFILIYWTAYC
jgi:hypothetical protein